MEGPICQIDGQIKNITTFKTLYFVFPFPLPSSLKLWPRVSSSAQNYSYHAKGVLAYSNNWIKEHVSDSQQVLIVQNLQYKPDSSYDIRNNLFMMCCTGSLWEFNTTLKIYFKLQLNTVKIADCQTKRSCENNSLLGLMLCEMPLFKDRHTVQRTLREYIDAYSR